MPAFTFEKLSPSLTRGRDPQQVAEDLSAVPEEPAWQEHLLRWRWVFGAVMTLTVICVIGYGSLGVPFKMPSYFPATHQQLQAIPVELISADEARRLGVR